MKFTGINTFIIVLAVCIPVGLCIAEEISSKPEDGTTKNQNAGERDPSDNSFVKRTDRGDWRITVGGTYSRPRLKQANRDIHTIESQLRPIAPGVKKFEDWDDVLKGTVRIGISRMLRIKEVILWPDFYIAYGSGYVETRQINLPTVYAVPVNYRFKQAYAFYQFNLGAFIEVFERKGFSATAGGYLTYGLLDADTNFSTNIPALGTTRHTKGKFREEAFGYTVVCNFHYELHFLKGFELSAATRYDWLKFKGPTKVDDYQSSPLGAMVLRYSQHTVSDMSGPSVFVGVSYKF